MKQLLIFLLAFNFSCTNKNLSVDTDKSILKSGFFEIIQEWSQQPNGYGRKIYVKVPDNELQKYPVVIVLHGNGGNASTFVNKFNYINNHVIIAPQGYQKVGILEKKNPKHRILIL